MKLKKIAIISAMALIVIGCLCAGCTSESQNQSSIDNSIAKQTNELTAVKQVAHRGLSSEAPENTLASFRLAGENGMAWGIECDIFKTADNVFVVTHDDSMMRMCDVDMNVTEHPIAEIQKYEVTNGNGIEKYPHEVFPTLEQYLELLQNYPTQHAVIEIKITPFTQDDAKNLLNLCKSYLPTEQLCFIAEDQDALLTLKTLDNSLQLQWIGDDYSLTNATIQWCIDNSIDMDINCSLATPELAERLHEHDLGINVWTINDKELAKQMIQNIGVDYLTSNYIFSETM